MNQKNVVEFPKMMYHENGTDTRVVESVEEQEGLGGEWAGNPVNQFHGCQPPEVLPVSPVAPDPKKEEVVVVENKEKKKEKKVAKPEE